MLRPTEPSGPRNAGSIANNQANLHLGAEVFAQPPKNCYAALTKNRRGLVKSAHKLQF